MILLSNAFCLFVCLFVLRFYGPVDPMGSCQARAIYLTTLLLDRLSPLSVNQYCEHYFGRNWQVLFSNQRKGENDRRKYFMMNQHEKMLPTRRWSPVGRASNWATEASPEQWIHMCSTHGCKRDKPIEQLACKLQYSENALFNVNPYIAPFNIIKDYVGIL